MLIAAVISLTSESKHPVLGPLGRPIQAWFLHQITTKNPKLAKTLHDSQGLKPYTVSTLLDRNGRPLSAGAWLQPGESYSIRITCFEEELSKLLKEQILSDLPEMLTLYKINLRVGGYTFDPREHPWAGKTTYNEIAQDSAYIKANNNIHLEYQSPTAFRSQGEEIPLPIPEQIFRNYWERWNKFAPAHMEIQNIWPAFVKDCITVKKLAHINTVEWQVSEENRRTYTGFTGTVTFKLLPANRRKEWKDFHEGAASVMQSLSTFAFYCGTGHHTTIGMGQTRPLR